MKSSTAILVSLLSVSTLTAPSQANAWVWLVARSIIHRTVTIERQVIKKPFTKPMQKRSPNRYPGSDRESRFKRF
jgi:hypothetical protein